MTELEKNRIKELHKEFSIIQEQTRLFKEGPQCEPEPNFTPSPQNRGNGGSVMSRISDKNLKTLVKRAYKKLKSEELREVYSEKQRRWACVQANLPTNKRQKSLSKKEADEMCGDVNISKKKYEKYEKYNKRRN